MFILNLNHNLSSFLLKILEPQAGYESLGVGLDQFKDCDFKDFDWSRS